MKFIPLKIYSIVTFVSELTGWDVLFDNRDFITTNLYFRSVCEIYSPQK